MNRLRQIVGELLEVIDHVVRAEGHHVALDRRTGDAGHDHQKRGLMSRLAIATARLAASSSVIAPEPAG
jgi:hypothetical protein